MRAKAAIKFRDLKAGVTREVGEEFECSKERFEQIVSKLGKDSLAEVKRKKPEPEGEDE